MSKVKIEDMIEYELINHECYYTGDYYSIVDIIKSYYPDFSSEKLGKSVERVYYSTKNKNMSAFDM